MSTVSEHIERLIVRKLDGELTEEESLQLDRELIRCPDARLLLEEYSRIDALCGAVIQASIDRSTETSVTADPVVSERPRTANSMMRSHRWMWCASAVAAFLALLMFLKTPSPSTDEPTLTRNRLETPGRISAPIPRIGNPGGEVGVFNAADIAPRPVNRVTDRNWYVVPDRNGAIFLLSLDRIREMEAPQAIKINGRHLDPV